MKTEAWLPDLARVPGSKYQAIADALGLAIESGELRAGDRLPPQRELAARLGVDLTTVTRAYDKVRSRGLIEAKGRAGSFVLPARRPTLAEPPAQVDSAMNMPPELPDGLLAKSMTATLDLLLGSGSGARLQYQPAGGTAHDRAAGARLFGGFGLPSVEEQVVVTAGGQNALHAILSATVRAGDAIACGTFVYTGFKAAAERLGAQLLPLPEMTAPALETLCRSRLVRALYLVPTNDNPTTATISPAEREALASVAMRYDLQIIEDDAYGPLAAEPLPPVSAFAPDRSWYVASMSKTLSPALRVAFVRAPSVSHALRLAADIHETAIMAPPLNVALVSAWILDGSFTRLVEAMRRESVWRQELARRLLGDVPYRAHPQGYHLWLPLPAGVNAAALSNALAGTGLSTVASDRFAVEPTAEQALRVSLGGLMDRERLAGALRVLHGYAASPIASVPPVI